MKQRLALLVVSSLLFSCATTPVAPPRGPIRARDYLPLAMGAAWSYDTDTGLPGGTVLSTLVVVRADAPRFLVRSGTHTETYEVRGDGVVREGDYLIRDPVQQGTSWTARDGARLEIRSVAQHRTVGGTDYANVIEVVRSGGETGLVTTTWYALDTGAIEINAGAQSSRGFATNVRSSLRGFVLHAE